MDGLYNIKIFRKALSSIIPSLFQRKNHINYVNLRGYKCGTWIQIVEISSELAAL